MPIPNAEPPRASGLTLLWAGLVDPVWRETPDGPGWEEGALPIPARRGQLDQLVQEGGLVVRAGSFPRTAQELLGLDGRLGVRRAHRRLDGPTELADGGGSTVMAVAVELVVHPPVAADPEGGRLVPLGIVLHLERDGTVDPLGTEVSAADDDFVRAFQPLATDGGRRDFTGRIERMLGEAFGTPPLTSEAPLAGSALLYPVFTALATMPEPAGFESAEVRHGDYVAWGALEPIRATDPDLPPFTGDRAPFRWSSKAPIGAYVERSAAVVFAERPAALEALRTPAPLVSSVYSDALLLGMLEVVLLSLFIERTRVVAEAAVADGAALERLEQLRDEVEEVQRGYIANSVSFGKLHILLRRRPSDLYQRFRVRWQFSTLRTELAAEIGRISELVRIRTERADAERQRAEAERQRHRDRVVRIVGPIAGFGGVLGLFATFVAVPAGALAEGDWPWRMNGVTFAALATGVTIVVGIVIGLVNEWRRR